MAMFESNPRTWPYFASAYALLEQCTTIAGQERYRLILLSNIDRYYWRVVQDRHPELEYFDAILLSCDLRMAKPDPDIFRRAAEIAGTDPPQCYFVDDMAINVAAAHDLGFHTHTFRNAPQLVATLAWTGIGDSG